MRRDVLFYEVFKNYSKVFFDLVGENRDASAYQFSSVELKESSFRLDGVLTALQASDPIFFVEFQAQKDKKFYARLFAEIGLHLYQNGIERDWTAVVFYSSRGNEASASPAHQFLLTLEKRVEFI